MYIYLLFFDELNTIKLEKYLSIADKIAYLIIFNVQNSSAEYSISDYAKKAYIKRHSILQSADLINLDEVNNHNILNYKKKY